MSTPFKRLPQQKREDEAHKRFATLHSAGSQQYGWRWIRVNEIVIEAAHRAGVNARESDVITKAMLSQVSLDVCAYVEAELAAAAEGA